jgi:uncharacterized protein YecT (DUF1311 family)
VILSVALALLAAQAAAPDCRDPQTQIDLNACAALDFEQADRALNAVWPEAIASARAGDSEIDRRTDRRPTSEARLREAQRAWLAFRDAHCAWQAYGEARGGSLEPLIYHGCRARLTRERIRQLAGRGE